jgi:hypothetical protein
MISIEPYCVAEHKFVPKLELSLLGGVDGAAYLWRQQFCKPARPPARNRALQPIDAGAKFRLNHLRYSPGRIWLLGRKWDGDISNRVGTVPKMNAISPVPDCQTGISRCMAAQLRILADDC